MRDLNDGELLGAFVDRQSEEAFTMLVQRHVALVYSAAMRQVGNAVLAEEVVQAVFIILANKASGLRGRASLAGWLCRTAHFAASNARKAEYHRQRREQEAATMDNTQDTDWMRLSPLLDEAVAQLGESDREAIVQRFFERKSLNEVGTVLGLNADAAQKRVSRALEKLRKFFTQRGVILSAAAIAAAVSANSVQAAPAALTISVVAAAKGSAAAVSTITLVKGALKLMAISKIKAGIVVAIVVAGIAVITTVVINSNPAPDPRPVSNTAPQNDGQSFPKSSWAFVGYDTPEAGLQSYIWAVSKADGKTFLASLSPNFALPEAAKTKLDEYLASRAAQLNRVSGFRIQEKQVKTEDTVTLRIEMGGANGAAGIETWEIEMRKFGNEWKFARLGAGN